MKKDGKDIEGGRFMRVRDGKLGFGEKDRKMEKSHGENHEHRA